MRAAVHSSVLAEGKGRADAARHSRFTSVARATTTRPRSVEGGDVALIISTFSGDGFSDHCNSATRHGHIVDAESRVAQDRRPASHRCFEAACRPLRVHTCPSVHTRCTTALAPTASLTDRDAARDHLQVAAPDKSHALDIRADGADAGKRAP